MNRFAKESTGIEGKGRIKYGQLGREYKPHIQPTTEEQLNAIEATFERHGLNVQLGG